MKYVPPSDTWQEEDVFMLKETQAGQRLASSLFLFLVVQLPVTLEVFPKKLNWMFGYLSNSHVSLSTTLQGSKIEKQQYQWIHNWIHNI